MIPNGLRLEKYSVAGIKSLTTEMTQSKCAHEASKELDTAVALHKFGAVEPAKTVKKGQTTAGKNAAAKNAAAKMAAAKTTPKGKSAAKPKSKPGDKRTSDDAELPSNAALETSSRIDALQEDMDSFNKDKYLSSVIRSHAYMLKIGENESSALASSFKIAAIYGACVGNVTLEVNGQKRQLKGYSPLVKIYKKQCSRQT